MSSLGYSEFNANTEQPQSLKGTANGGHNANNANNGKKPRNKTLKMPQAAHSTALPPISNVVSREAESSKLKEFRDYIENIHRKGGEIDDEEDDDYVSDLPAYPGQGMGQGIAPTPTSTPTHTGVNVTKNTLEMPPMAAGGGAGPMGVRRTTQNVMLSPSASYSSTLLEGMALQTAADGEIGHKGQKEYNHQENMSEYARQYYDQYTPYMDGLKQYQKAIGGNGGNNTELIEKLNYIIHMLEQQHDEKTGHVMEELVLYCFLGVFIIFVVDSFARAGKYVR